MSSLFLFMLFVFFWLLTEMSFDCLWCLYRFKVPDGCDLVAAGALPVAFGTSHIALVHRAQLSSGQVGVL